MDAAESWSLFDAMVVVIVLVRVVGVMDAIVVHGKCRGSCGGEPAVASRRTGWLWHRGS